MNTLTKKVMAIIMSSTLTSVAIAEGTAPWLKVSGDVNVDTTGNSANDYEAKLKLDATLRFEVLMHEGIKAVIKARIEQVLIENGEKAAAQSLELEKMLEEAYIEIQTDKVSGLPRAIVTVGKHEMAFGQALSKLPMFRDNMLFNLAAEREMIGLTVTLPVTFFKLVDSIAVSLYETGAGDFSISDNKGASVRVSKQMSQKIKAQASALIKENAGMTKKESRGSIGFVFDGGEDSYQVWAEGLVFNNNPTYSETRFGSQIGAAKKLGVGTVVVEYSYLDKYAHELAVAYNIPVNSWLVISPELRHTKDSTGFAEDNTRIGVQARVMFQTESTKKLRTRK
jgi:hypothetical protein